MVMEYVIFIGILLYAVSVSYSIGWHNGWTKGFAKCRKFYDNWWNK